MSPRPPFQVALLTGQSDPSRWTLSPAQQAFLQAVGVPEHCRVPRNFPYRAGSPAYRPVPLIKASLNNGALYLRSRGRSFRREHAPDLERLLEAAQHTIFLAGSCGLELFNNLKLPEPLLRRASLFAFGPVARRRPACKHVLVGGRGDTLSRFYFPRPDHTVDCGHLGYLGTPALQALCRSFIEKSADAAAAKDP